MAANLHTTAQGKVSPVELRNLIRAWNDSTDRGDTNALYHRMSDLLRRKGLLLEPERATESMD
jgi:predicted deacylase